MANRVTPTDVKELLSTSLADSVIRLWIDAANIMVNSNIGCINGDSAKLTSIELYLSAHFIALLSPSSGAIRISEKIDSLKTEYAQQFVKDQINLTTFGTMANMLSGGCLANTSGSLATVGFF